MKRSILWAVAGAVSLSTSASMAAGSENLFSSAPSVWRSVESDSAYQALAKEPMSHAISVVMANAALVDETTQSLSLNLDIGGPITVNARQTSVERQKDGTIVWQGTLADATKPVMLESEIKDDPMNSVVIVRNGDKLTGNIRVMGQLYKLRPLHDSRHVIVEADESLAPADHPASAYRKIFVEAMPAPKADNTSRANTVIRVLVNYTARAASASGDINSLINLAITESNRGYTNSDVFITLQLAGKAQVSYTESGNWSTDLSRYRGTSDGYMDSIHSTRNSTAADVGVLIIDNDSACGLASAIGASASTAFAAVHWDCATGYYSFAHEIGHLQSARHDPANDPTNTPYAYGHGYQYPTGRWRTIMAYNCSSVNCTRLNFWSNPNKTYGGVPMGTANRHDNHRVLNNTRATVSGFR
ncbi:zinc-dependent metalloprotease [Tahibacter amnicola]|uniref:Zinc-dependent metalloprotease n=1 Tax=Tahibacter amnicola TaxID=2976241 RepID=A0ABY6BIT8_9GAMM|nr:zinc-dependent metalloprotease [Tahibacter amnicola]UXI69283.1 zinc-dependent metalloprotease [Tahibacter amnicola]